METTAVRCDDGNDDEHTIDSTDRLRRPLLIKATTRLVITLHILFKQALICIHLSHVPVPIR